MVQPTGYWHTSLCGKYGCPGFCHTAEGYEFDYWSGNCTGTEACSIVMTENKSVTANFRLKNYTISGNAELEGVAIIYTGGSTVTDEYGDYSFTVNHGWSGTVTPSLTGYTFDPEYREYSSISSNQAKQDFDAIANQYTLSVSKSGAGSGSVTSDPTGISCGADCTEDYDYNTKVTLTALASADSGFVGWGGACSGTGVCIVTMNDDVNVTAQFEPLPKIQLLDLVNSLDKSTWEDVYGDLGSGFRMALYPEVEFHYLDVSAVSVNHTLANGYYGFYLDVTDLPGDFYTYWAAKGVTSGADPASWQYQMWQIISGAQPMFYLKVGTSPEYQLIDGLVFCWVSRMNTCE